MTQREADEALISALAELGDEPSRRAVKAAIRRFERFPRNIWVNLEALYLLEQTAR